MIFKHRLGQVILNKAPVLDSLLSMAAPDQNVRKVLMGNLATNIITSLFKATDRKTGEELERLMRSKRNVRRK